ncbi:CPBP family intramembrane metalloprotease, partial [bacterium]|nr:CPBP family intramembrane metalloprotease [bacterium]
IFLLYHVIFFQSFHPMVVLTFFPGLLFGILKEKTGSLLAPILFHAICNYSLLSIEIASYP